MRILTFEGTPREMGRAFGEACRDEIHAFYDLRVQNALGQAKAYGDRDVSERHLLGVARASIGPSRAFDPACLDELEGISEGADLSVEKVLAMNGLTDFRDVLAWHGDLESFGGCSSAIVQSDVTESGRALCGQTWDLATDNMPFVLGIVRKPTGGPVTRCLTTVGCLSLIGMNEHGVSVGTTNIRTHDARAGVNYLFMIHKALACRTVREAVTALVAAERSGAHYYYLVDEERAVALETTAELSHEDEVTGGFFVHTNHCLVDAHKKIEADTPAASSHQRQKRFEELLAADRGKVTPARFQAYLADTKHGENAICRDNFNGISSNGGVVMEPASRRVWACHGMPDRAEWVELT